MLRQAALYPLSFAPALYDFFKVSAVNTSGENQAAALRCGIIVRTKVCVLAE